MFGKNRLISGDERETEPAPGAEPEFVEEPNLAPGETPEVPEAGSVDLFKLDLDKLGEIPVRPAVSEPKQDVPSSFVATDDSSNRGAATTGELLERASNVNVRRTSAINLDALVRGFNTEQTVAVANGMNELKTRVDVDSLFSQVDPGIVRNITVIDGPYSSLYGPGFAFLVAELDQGQRYADGYQGHASIASSYGTNGGAIYTRANAWGGGADHSVYFSYGLRTGHDYRTGKDFGTSNDARIPSSYNKQDYFLALSQDVTTDSRLDFNYLRTEINNLELPGVVYDLDNSNSNQFNFKYVLQDDPDGPEQFVIQSWFHDAEYQGDASSPSKQNLLYRHFFTPVVGDEFQVNTVGAGRSTSMGARTFMTIGDADQSQWTLGADWRRSTTMYTDHNIRPDGLLIYSGNLYGIPSSSQNDVGVFTDYQVPVSDATTVTIGGRLDYVWNEVDPNDPVITTIIDPAENYYLPGFSKNANGLGMAYLTQRSQVTEAWTVNSGAAFAMRNANPSELYSDEPYVPLYRFGNSYVDGNSNLAPEQNFQLDLGTQYRNEAFAFGVRGYHSLIHNYIMPVARGIDGPAAGFDTHVLGRDFSAFPYREDIDLGTTNADNSSMGFVYGNIPWVTLWGLDCTAEYHVQPWLSLSATANYVHGTNHSPRAFDEDQGSNGRFVGLGGSDPLPNIYPLNGTLHVRFLEPENDKWSCEFVTRLVASQNRVAATVAELPTDGFTVCSLRGYYRPRERWRLTAAIENLFNQSYTQHGSLVILGPDGRPNFVREPGVSFFFGSEFTF